MNLEHLNCEPKNKPFDKGASGAFGKRFACLDMDKFS
jgi:hypothetical protein